MIYDLEENGQEVGGRSCKIREKRRQLKRKHSEQPLTYMTRSKGGDSAANRGITFIQGWVAECS